MPPAKSDVETNVFLFEFVYPEGAPPIPFADLAFFFENIRVVIVSLVGIGVSTDGWVDPSEIRVASIEMHSPLKLALDFGDTPKEVVKAIIGFLESILFYGQERDRRRAEAASEWEDVYAKRLANIKEAVKLAASVNAKATVHQRAIHRLLEAEEHLEDSPLRLRSVKKEGE